MPAHSKVLLMDNIIADIELVENFSREGYSCVSAALPEMKDLLADKRVSCVLLEISNSDSDGFDACHFIRQNSDVPIIVVSNRANVADKIRAFDLGADDFIIKPYDPREIFARMKAIIRRSRIHMMEEGVDVGPLRIDMDNYLAYINGNCVSMPPREIELLNFLASNLNKVVSRVQVLEKVWGFDFYGDSRTVDVHIKRIREKINKYSNLMQIRTIWGIGYKFECDIAGKESCGC